MSRIHDKTTATHIAACAALGLHYWSGHPLRGRVWAVDNKQQPHVVRVYAKAGTACLQRVSNQKTKVWSSWGGYRTVEELISYDIGPVVDFEVSDSTQLTFAA